MELLPHRGPHFAPSSRADSGFRTSSPWKYAMGAHELAAAAGSVRRATLRAVSTPIVAGSTLSYVVFPAFAGNDADPAGGYGACAAAVDLLLDDGSRLSGTALCDQYGFGVSAQAQGAAKTVVPDQWNIRRVDLSALAGRTVVAIEAAVHVPKGLADTSLAGWIDDVVIRTVDALPDAGLRPSDHVRSTRGTHSSGALSRGNALPATAVPYGFNFITPATEARTTQWVYAYHQHDVAPGTSALQALSISHQPSPWMNDYSVLQFMPGTTEGTPDPAPAARALAFRHGNEDAKAHRYRVRFDNGLVAEAAPTDHAAALRFVYPGDDATLLIDQLDDNGSLVIGMDAAGRPVLSGYVDGSSGSTALRMYFYATADRPLDGFGKFAGAHANVSGYLRFRLDADRTVNFKVATSFISVAMARHSLELEIPDGVGVDAIAALAQDLWDEKLGAVQVAGASADQLATLYSNLYRMFLYPNSASENAGTAQDPQWQYASFLRPAAKHGAEATGAPVRAGRIYVNNGFWDTYRTEWPALCLLDPDQAGRMLDGFVEHYREGGWTPRWSAPGYADCMVGTSSDLVFADAARNGVGGFDLEQAYDSALRNATVPSDASATGRKGLGLGIFTGYIPTSTDEAMSWSLENAISDFGIAQFSEVMLDRSGEDDPRRSEYAANAAYFANRALGYKLLFDPSVGFFQGRDSDGTFRHTPETFDPRVWGHDYTETNAWGMAFSVPHDGAGLAGLYGGRAGLEAKLDEYFSTPETAREEFRGSYWAVIHEMVEARNIRMGMFGISNQPAHHAPFMYAFTDAPHKMQAITREAVGRLFTGSEIGQGYPGDEDNGEMSAWYVFAALGFYPLSLASGGFILTSPLYGEATVTLAGGKTITIRATNNARENVYIQSVAVNGVAWESPFIDHATLADGATLEFVMGPEPSGWGSSPELAPPSLSAPGSQAVPASDLTTPAGAATASVPDAHLAFDDSSATGVRLHGGDWVGYALRQPAAVPLYTITAGPALSGWDLQGSADGHEWTAVERRRGETFRWERQTRPFLVPSVPDADRFRHYRVRVAGHPAASATLYQLELFPEH
ncbi:GH92 family glycosyl hydrolase [Pseudarthrobacter sp. P1]|uniref:GH92 family glycosyl hydrolase n=1 Tax=Pseudarthrobacter sp. P1 TaxID=3418418 RepID=UPI003CE6969D